MKKIIAAIIVAVLYALVVRYIFGVNNYRDLFSIMSFTFFILLPIGIGVISMLIASRGNVESLAYRIFMPWIPVFIFFTLTLIFSIEGWACWLMIMPLYLLGSSIGGLIGGYIKLRKKSNTLNVSLLVLAPLVGSPIEQLIGPEKEVFEAYTYIDINADATNIWQHVTRVSEITENEDKGTLNNFLGMPRPLYAVLDTLTVGGKREAVFTGGLVFHEEVLKYEHEHEMLFSITAHPFEIPSTTMDEHIVIGGDYFDVIDGEYRLEKLDHRNYRLHLSSHYSMNTTFNFYAGWWGELIMKDIQNNILQVIKNRVAQDSE